MKRFSAFMTESKKPSDADSRAEEFAHHAQANDLHLHLSGMYLGNEDGSHDQARANHHFREAERHVELVRSKFGEKHAQNIEGGTKISDSQHPLGQPKHMLVAMYHRTEKSPK